MKILVTGGAGFVGSNLAISLRSAFADCEVVAMDNHRRGSELNLPDWRRRACCSIVAMCVKLAVFPLAP